MHAKHRQSKASTNTARIKSRYEITIITDISNLITYVRIHLHNQVTNNTWLTASINTIAGRVVTLDIARRTWSTESSRSFGSDDT